MQARMLAIGGRDQLTPDHLADVAQHWQKDARFLAEFGQRIARGELTEQQIIHNAEQYASANLRDTYEEGRTLDATRAGYQEEAWELGIADHCPGCEAQAMRGYVAIGELPEIGSQDCRMGCHCGKEQRVSEDQVYPKRAVLADSAGAPPLLMTDVFLPGTPNYTNELTRRILSNGAHP